MYNIGHISPCSCKSFGGELARHEKILTRPRRSECLIWWQWSLPLILQKRWWSHHYSHWFKLVVLLSAFFPSRTFFLISGVFFPQGFWTPWLTQLFILDLRRPGDGRASLPVVLTDGLTEMEQVMVFRGLMECEEGLKEFLFLLFFGFVAVFHVSFFLLSTLFLFLSALAGVGNETSRDGIHWKDGPREALPAGGRENHWLSVMNRWWCFHLPPTAPMTSWVGGPKWRTPPGLCPNRNLGRGRKDDFGKGGRAICIFLRVGRKVCWVSWGAIWLYIHIHNFKNTYSIPASNSFTQLM